MTLEGSFEVPKWVVLIATHWFVFALGAGLTRFMARQRMLKSGMTMEATEKYLGRER